MSLPITRPAPSGAIRSSAKIWTIGTLTYTTSGLVVLFVWLLWGDFAWSMKERAIWPSMQVMCKKFDASDLTVGLLMGTIPALISLLVCPIISYRSDRYRSHWGRRIPFLLIPTPFIVLAMVAMAYSPESGRWLHGALGELSPGINPASLIMLGLFWTIFEAGTLAANTVFGGLVNDVVPHRFLGRFYGLFRALSLMAGILFNYILMGKVEEDYAWIFIGMALLYAVGFTTMCLKVREGEYPSPVTVKSDSPSPSAVRSYFRECFGNSYYLLFFACMSLCMMAQCPTASFQIAYAKNIGMSLDTYGKCLALTFGISLVLAYPIGVLVDRLHPLRLSIAATALLAVVNILGGYFVTSPGSFAVAVVAQGVCAGIFLTASASLNQILLPKEKFLQYVSALGILSCLGGMTINPLIGLVLDLSGQRYYYLFYITAALLTVALVGFFILYQRFIRYGGIKGYVAPQ